MILVAIGVMLVSMIVYLRSHAKTLELQRQLKYAQMDLKELESQHKAMEDESFLQRDITLAVWNRIIP